jgi:lipopolysaccharide biosynthesis glycosyltransferase
VSRSQLDVAFGIDGAYLPHLAVVIESLARHAPGAEFRFIILHSGVTESRRRQLEAVAPDARFLWTELAEADVPGPTDRGHFNRACVFRLGLERHAPPDCGRVLYLDADIVVTGDVREVFEVDLAGAPLAAVVDSYQDASEFATRWNLPANDLGYFNSGLLLLDFEQVRAQSLLSQAAALVVEHDKDLKFPDQDALNQVFWGRWKPMPPLWNVQRNSAIPAMSAELVPELRLENRWPRMVHYTGPEKPWVMSGYHPWSQLYWDSLARTPFLAEVVQTFKVSALDRLRIWLRWLRRRPPRENGRARA